MMTCDPNLTGWPAGLVTRGVFCLSICPSLYSGNRNDRLLSRVAVKMIRDSVGETLGGLMSIA